MKFKFGEVFFFLLMLLGIRMWVLALKTNEEMQKEVNALFEKQEKFNE